MAYHYPHFEIHTAVLRCFLRSTDTEDNLSAYQTCSEECDDASGLAEHITKEHSCPTIVNPDLELATQKIVLSNSHQNPYLCPFAHRRRKDESDKKYTDIRLDGPRNNDRFKHLKRCADRSNTIWAGPSVKVIGLYWTVFNIPR